jgi:hypothetical protein
MIGCRSRHVLPVLLFLTSILITHLQAGAETNKGETELTAVFLVENVYLGPPSIAVMDVRQTGPITSPTEEELIAAVADLFGPEHHLFPQYFQALDVVGHFRLIFHEPGDFGAAGLVDVRDGAVAFAGGVVWMGFGQTVQPTSDSHPWVFEAGPMAPAAAAFNHVHNPMWSDESLGNQSYFLKVGLNHIRQTDVMRNFGGSAPYTVTGYLHTPTVGAVDPAAAVAVLIISGQAGPPWGPEPVATTSAVLGQIKALYR